VTWLNEVARVPISFNVAVAVLAWPDVVAAIIAKVAVDWVP